MSQNFTEEHPLTNEQAQRAAAVAISSSLGAPSTEALLTVAEYIVGAPEPAPFVDFGTLQSFNFQPIEFSLGDVNEDALRTLFGCDTEEPCEDCPFGPQAEADEDADVSDELDEALAEWERELLRPFPRFNVGDVVKIKQGHRRAGHIGTVTGVSEYRDNHPDYDWGHYYVFVETGPIGVEYEDYGPLDIWENYVEPVPEYLQHDRIEGEVFVVDVEGLDALPVGAVIETLSGDVALVKGEDGEVYNTRFLSSSYQGAVTYDLRNGTAFRVIHGG